MPAVLGDCYKIAGKHMLDNPLTTDILCHGEVMGQGQLGGVKYGHAWIEDGDMVIDRSNGRDLRMPKMIYYAIAKIGQPYFDDDGYHPGKENVHRYTHEETMAQIMKYEHWGPWDLVTETGL